MYCRYYRYYWKFRPRTIYDYLVDVRYGMTYTIIICRNAILLLSLHYNTMYTVAVSVRRRTRIAHDDNNIINDPDDCIRTSVHVVV